MSRGTEPGTTERRRAGGPTPRRKRVVLSSRRKPRQATRTVVELEEQTSVGEVLVQHLTRIQLRSALVLTGVTLLPFCGLPAVFWALPEIGDVVVLGIRLPWLLLGVLPFPFLVVVGYLSARSAERHERDFLNIVER